MEAEELKGDTKVLSEFAAKIVDEMKKGITKVTGKSANSIEFYLTQQGFRILGSESVVANIVGRGPTGAAYFKQEKTLQQIILEWIIAKGITSTDLSQVALSWAISMSIHKKGTLLYQRGGAGNFMETIWTDERVNTFMNQYSGTLAERTMEYLITNFAKK